ncbi:MAG TPA: M20 family metallopeptidase [Granulicella sp.]
MAALDLKAVFAALQARSRWIEQTLHDLVLIESPTESAKDVNRAAAFVIDLASAFGGRARLHKQKHFGHITELRFGPRRSAAEPILLLGHLDTIWPLGTLQSMPWRVADGRYYGPGVLDMKAGVVMALATLATLHEQRLLTRPVTFLLNSEEEIGSPVSRPITESLARESSAVLVLEPAQGLACKTARKGIGHYTLHVQGVGAHSGVDFDRGHSAILELAHQVQAIAALTDPTKQRTLNCGVIAGGTRSNIVAPSASVEIDLRIATARDGVVTDKLLHRLKPIDPACTLTLTGGINRPPMERRAGTIALYKRARKLAAQLGFTLDEAATGGGSDGNFTAALGVSTLDGLGAVGEGAHAAHESVVIEHLVPRAALLAAMIAAN